MVLVGRFFHVEAARPRNDDGGLRLVAFFFFFFCYFKGFCHFGEFLADFVYRGPLGREDPSHLLDKHKQVPS